MRKRMLFVYNPHAGKGALRSKLSDVIDIFMSADYEVTIYATQKRKDATNIVRERAAEFDYVVCSGGDGTLNEVTDGLMTRKLWLLEREGEDAKGGCPPCGYIPTGTVNDFASSLNIPKNILKAARCAVEGEWFPYDVGSLNGDYFNYVAAFGAFTETAYETPQSSKNLLGRMAYILDGAMRIPSLTSYHMVIEHDGQSVEDDFIFGMVTNSNSIGGFKGLNGKDVRLDDGLFEAAFIRMPRTAAELQAIINSLVAREPDEAYIYSFLGGDIRICSKQEVSWTVDGEYGGAHAKSRIVNHRQAITYRRGASLSKSE